MGFLDLGAQYRLRDRLYWLLLFPLILYWIYKKQNNPYESRRYLKLFILSVTIAAMYGLARIPQLNQFIIFSAARLLAETQFCF